MNAHKFNDFLLKNAARFDEEFLSTFNPMQDSWIGNVTTGPFNPWWDVRELVRKISEGLAFKPSESEPPDISQDWNAMTKKDWDKFEKDCESK